MGTDMVGSFFLRSVSSMDDRWAGGLSTSWQRLVALAGCFGFRSGCWHRYAPASDTYTHPCRRGLDRLATTRSHNNSHSQRVSGLQVSSRIHRQVCWQLWCSHDFGSHCVVNWRYRLGSSSSFGRSSWASLESGAEIDLFEAEVINYWLVRVTISWPNTVFHHFSKRITCQHRLNLYSTRSHPNTPHKSLNMVSVTNQPPPLRFPKLLPSLAIRWLPYGWKHGFHSQWLP